MAELVVVVSLVTGQEGLFRAVPFDEARRLCKKQGYRLATPAEQNQYEQAQKHKSDLRE